MLDIAIIGGGPGGLAVALALRQAAPNLKVQVFERATTLAPRGAGLRIAPNGLKALAAIDFELPADLAKRAFQATKAKTTDCEGNLLQEYDFAALDAASEAQYGYRPLLLGWWELTETLASKLPDDALVLGASFKSAEAAPHGVNVFMQDRDAIKAKLLLGCDGYNSRVWESVIGGKPAQFEYTVLWRARVPFAEVLETLDEVLISAGGGMISTVFPISNGDVVWTFSATSDILQERGLGEVVQAHAERKGSQYTGSQRLEHCLRVFEGHYPDVLLRLVHATNPDTILEQGVWARNPAEMPQGGALSDGPWSVLGDAFHPMRPTGDGAGLTFEDAAILGAAAAEHGATPAMLRAYEAQRLPRVLKIMETTMVTGRSSYGQGGPAAPKEIDGQSYGDYLNSIQFQALTAHVPLL